MPLVILCFIAFFGLAELLPAMQGLTLPMPAYIVAGVLLAIASNYRKPAALPWRSQPPVPPMPKQNSAPPLAKPSSASLPPKLDVPASEPSQDFSVEPSPSPSKRPTGPQLPNFDLRPRPSVSFVVKIPPQHKKNLS